jgi:UDP-3-O-[3-hydroxymyristoyl] glucosamine N-acyltransferase
LAKLLNLYEQSKPKRVGIDPLAFVAETAKIGKDVYIEDWRSDLYRYSGGRGPGTY